MQTEHEGRRLQQSSEYTHVPEELQHYCQWVNWTYYEVNGRLTKPPMNPTTGQLASPTNPATWGTYAQALHALKQGSYEGIGFVFTSTDPFTGTDLDHCVGEDGTLEPWARNIVARLNSYTEYSPSGTGVHILTQAHLPEGGRRKENTEMYDRGRYFTLTGHHVAGTPDTIRDRQSDVLRLYDALSTPLVEMRSKADYALIRSDEAVLQKAMAAKNGTSFSLLWQGDLAGFTSKSEADFVLVLRLLYWCNDDVAQVRRLFERSGLSDAKTHTPRGETDYLGRTIQNALKKRHR